jgi:acylphosphatase
VSDDVVRLSAFVHGRVQGVGFRWWVRSQALELGLDGFARNLPDGRVEVLAQGPRDACETLLSHLQPEADGERPGRVDGVTDSWLPVLGLPPGFHER